MQIYVYTNIPLLWWWDSVVFVGGRFRGASWFFYIQITYIPSLRDRCLMRWICYAAFLKMKCVWILYYLISIFSVYIVRVHVTLCKWNANKWDIMCILSCIYIIRESFPFFLVLEYCVRTIVPLVGLLILSCAFQKYVRHVVCIHTSVCSTYVSVCSSHLVLSLLTYACMCMQYMHIFLGVNALWIRK